MKNLLYFILIMGIPFSGIANDKFEKAMAQNISSLYEAKTVQDFQESINKFERIAQAESKRWEPKYYISYAYIMIAFREQSPQKKDEIIALAQKTLDEALAIAPNESELVTLQGLVYTAKLTVDPASRGPQYSGMSMQTFGKAIALNPENPRAYLLLGQMQLGTAKFMGTGTEEACKSIATALSKFDSYVPASAIYPMWGKESAIEVQKQCEAP